MVVCCFSSPLFTLVHGLLPSVTIMILMHIVFTRRINHIYYDM